MLEAGPREAAANDQAGDGGHSVHDWLGVWSAGVEALLQDGRATVIQAWKVLLHVPGMINDSSRDGDIIMIYLAT